MKLSFFLPAGLDHARQKSIGCRFSKTETAHCKFADECSRPSTERTTVIFSCRKLRLLFRFCHEGFTSHSLFSLLSEREAKRCQKRLALFVILCGSANRYTQSANFFDFVVVHFRKNDLFFDTAGIVPTTVKAIS